MAKKKKKEAKITPLKIDAGRQWIFEGLLSGEVTEVYKVINTYWEKRFFYPREKPGEYLPKKIPYVHVFRTRSYSPTTDNAKFEFLGVEIGMSKYPFLHNKHSMVFIMKLGKRIIDEK